MERLMEMDLTPDMPEADYLKVLATLVETYEAKHYPIGLPAPIEVIKIRMVDMGSVVRTRSHSLVPEVAFQSSEP
jgi:HTH-type transcriptional regulator/antitoxin HigA